jgi:hypothetical protein
VIQRAFVDARLRPDLSIVREVTVQVLALLFAAFAVAFVAGLGWYTAQHVVQGLAGKIGGTEMRTSRKVAALTPAAGEISAGDPQE